MKTHRHAQFFLTLAALSSLVASVAVGTPPSAEATTPAQIEADWLRQDVVRNLPPVPVGRSQPAVTTQQDAAGAVDGIQDGTYGFHTAQDDSPWWEVDLGKSVPLDRVVVYNRCDGDVDHRAVRLKVLLSDDGQTWEELYRHDGTKFLGQPDGHPLSIPARGAKARIVRIQLPARQYFHLDEVEVYRTGSDRNVALQRPADQSSVSPWSKTGLPAVATVEDAHPDEPTAEYRTGEVIERGLKLADDLQRRGVDVEADVEVLQRVAAAINELPPDTPPSICRKLYSEARWAVRRMALANPLLDFDDLLLVKRVPGTFTHMSDQYYGWFSRPGGGLYILKDFKSETPRLVCLSDQLPTGSIIRPDVSYDGRRVLFAHCKHYPGLRDEKDKLNKANVPEDAFYQLYEMHLDGSGLRRLTRGKYDNFDGRYLPDGRIVFLSTRRGQSIQTDRQTALDCIDGARPDIYVRCGGGPERPVAVYTLHVMDSDGTDLQQISPFEMFEWTPSIDDQGRILYARWDYVDRHNMPYESLWSTMPDGTAAQAIFGNSTRNPHCMFEVRSIPDSRKLIFTASGHHAMTGGCLVLLDPSRGADGQAPMQRLTPEVVFPESEGWPNTYYANPYPLSEEHYLVAWSAAPLPPGTPRPAWGMPGPPNDLGVYLFDAFGNLNLIYRDPQISSMYPLPIKPRRRPPSVSSLANNQAPSQSQMVLIDVYQGLESIEPGSIRRLRLVGVPAKTHPTMNYPVMGLTRDDPGKFVMGTVPVEADGSAHFYVPSGVTFFLQALDAEGMAVQTMRSATYLQPGQTYTCIGCHEQRHTAPPNVSPMASRRGPSKITPGAEGSWPLDFQVLVQPVLQQHCVACHGPGGEDADFDLTAGKSYDTLVAYGTPSLRDHVLARYGEGRSVAGACAARMNPLVKLLAEGHHDVELGPDGHRRLFTWMDTYGQRLGSFDEHQETALYELRRRMKPILAD